MIWIRLSRPQVMSADATRYWAVLRSWRSEHSSSCADPQFHLSVAEDRSVHLLGSVECLLGALSAGRLEGRGVGEDEGHRDDASQHSERVLQP